MSTMSALRPLGRESLVPPEDLVSDGIDEPYVLALPDGDIELWKSDRGELFVFAYSTVPLLVESCGAAQPAARLTVARLDELQAGLRAALLVALDVRHPDGHRFPETDIREREPLAHAEHLSAPAEVWIPSFPLLPGDSAARVELYGPAGGDPMLFAYWSLADLRAACGPYQAAVSVRADDLRQVAEEAGAAGVLFDAELSEELKHQQPVVDWRRGPLRI
jgi:hypothetical protein